jgi:hypothetical protein
MHLLVPRLWRSKRFRELSQPFRAGLTFGFRPYGPVFDFRFVSSSLALLRRTFNCLPLLR